MQKALFATFLFMAQILAASEIDTLDVPSPSMRKIVRTVVVAPNALGPGAEPLPVVYLLHGWSGNYSSWLVDAPHLAQKADELRMVLVMPDGGYDSWWLDSAVDPGVRYATFLSEELPFFIESNFNVVKNKAGRAIAGLSMGGHGALFNALKRPDVFGCAGSMCGGVDLRPWRKNDWDLKGVLGDPRSDWKNWEAASVAFLAENLEPEKAPLMLIDCGTDDFFIEMNRDLHRILLKKQIPHDWTERPGEHNSEYWSAAVDFQLLFARRFFDAR